MEEIHDFMALLRNPKFYDYRAKRKTENKRGFRDYPRIVTESCPFYGIFTAPCFIIYSLPF